MKGITDPAAVGLTLPAAERRVARPGPTPGIMVEGGWVTKLVDVRQVRRQIFFDVIEEQVFVDRTGRSAFRAGAVVGDQHDQGVLKLAERFQEVKQATHMEIGVFHEAGEDLHHVGVQPFLIRRKRIPLGDIGIMPGKLSIRRDEAHLFLPGEGLFAVDIPALIKLSFILIGPFLAHMMGCVHGAGSRNT